MSKYYVYIFKHKDMPFYVGKGTSNRMYRHRQDAIKKKINSPLHNKIRKIIEANETKAENYEELYEIEKEKRNSFNWTYVAFIVGLLAGVYANL